MDTVRPYTAPEGATNRDLVSCYGYLLQRNPRWFDGMSASDLRAAIPDPVAHARAAFDAIEARIQSEREAMLKRPRSKPIKPAVNPSWIQTTRRPEPERRSALVAYHHNRWSYSSRGTKGAA